MSDILTYVSIAIVAAPLLATIIYSLLLLWDSEGPWAVLGALLFSAALIYLMASDVFEREQAVGKYTIDDYIKGFFVGLEDRGYTLDGQMENDLEALLIQFAEDVEGLDLTWEEKPK